MNNGNGTFTITYTDGSTFTSAPMAGTDTNLATDNLVQDPENRTYDMNSRNLAFTNGRMGVGITGPTSTLQTGGSFAASIRSTTSSTTMTDSDVTLVMYQRNLLITLPAPSSCPGRIYILKNISSGDNWTSLNYINDGGSNDNRLRSDRTYWLQSDGTYWHQISRD